MDNLVSSLQARKAARKAKSKKNTNNKPITKRTLARWVERGVIHPPVSINGRNYYRSEWVDQLASRKGEAAP